MRTPALAFIKTSLDAIFYLKVRHENLKVTKDAAEEVENILKGTVWFILIAINA